MSFQEEYVDYIIHYGTPGMKWGVRKEEYKSLKKSSKQIYKTLSKEQKKAVKDIRKLLNKKWESDEFYKQNMAIGKAEFARGISQRGNFGIKTPKAIAKGNLKGAGRHIEFATLSKKNYDKYSKELNSKIKKLKVSGIKVKLLREEYKQSSISDPIGVNSLWVLNEPITTYREKVMISRK